MFFFLASTLIKSYLLPDSLQNFEYKSESPFAVYDTLKTNN